MRLDKLKQPTYVERLFADLLKIHQEDHCKGSTLFAHARDWHGNITQEVCKMFMDVCPHCIKVLSCRKPAAGIKNIVTDGFGVCRQVDLINFQSMPDVVFKYLCNYIDHGVKKLTSIPLSGKQASSVAFALLTIFTEQGPPSILQTDNGGEFSNHAHNHVGRWMVLEDKFIDLVIKELKNLWPKCQMVRGSPQHSESNGGIERVNQTVQKKLAGWIKTNNTQHWLIGFKIVQWRINTQVHQTIKDTPYHLTYGQHPWVGISNLPVSAEILANLRTEAELQDVYLLMNSSIDVANNCVVLPNDGFDAAIVAVTIATADRLVDTLVSLSPLGKHKGRSPQDSSQLSREIRDAKRTAMSTAVVCVCVSGLRFRSGVL